MIPGQPPQVGAQITGCRFAERCPAAIDACRAAADRAGTARPGAPVPLRPRQRSGAGRRARDRTGRPVTAPATDATVAARRVRPLLSVENVDVVLGRGWRANHVLSGVNLNDLARRDRRPGRRDRIGQDHTGQDRGRPGPAEEAAGSLRRQRDLPAARRRAAPGAPAWPRPARLPGPAALARPGPHRRADRRRGAADPRRPRRRGDRGAGNRGAGQGRPRRDAAVPHARPDLRRPAAAGLHRPGPGGRSRAAALRRAGQRARREQPELHPAPARRPARQPEPAHRHHLARPELARGHRRPGGGALPGPDRRGRPGRPGVHRAQAPLHRAADGVGAERQARPAALGPPAPPHRGGPGPRPGPARPRARACSPPAARSRATPARSSRPSSRWPEPTAATGARPATGTRSGPRSRGKGPPWRRRASPAGASRAHATGRPGHPTRSKQETKKSPHYREGTPSCPSSSSA